MAIRVRKLSPAARELLRERDRIVDSWRNLTVTPEAAVARLSQLSTKDRDGTAWRLLPRESGVALVRTTVDGDASIVEPPVTHPKWPAIVCMIALVVAGGAAVWGQLQPATDGGERTPDTTTTVLP